MTDLADTAVSEGELQQQLERYRVELTGYCYRMLGSGFEAEDAVQDTLVRAWRNIDRFEGRSLAALVALPHRHQRLPRRAGGPQRRARPMDLGPRGTAEPPARRPQPRGDLGAARARRPVVPTGGDPAELAVARESRSGWPSSPRCSTCRRASGPC